MLIYYLTRILSNCFPFLNLPHGIGPVARTPTLEDQIHIVIALASKPFDHTLIQGKIQIPLSDRRVFLQKPIVTQLPSGIQSPRFWEPPRSSLGFFPLVSLPLYTHSGRRPPSPVVKEIVIYPVSAGLLFYGSV